MQTAENLPLTAPPTWRRLIAILIDSILAGLIATPVVMAILNSSPDDLAPYLMNSFPAWAFIIGFNLYILHSSGQTIGKRVMKLRVSNPDGSRATFSRLLLRRYLPLLILLLIPYLGPLLLLAALLPVLGPSQLGLHDRLSNTRVIQAVTTDT
jgi:uncharacterized RDD family membrane protein YckC